MTASTVCGRTVFHDDWWLDIAGKGKLRQVEVSTDGVAASLAFVPGRYRGFRQLDIPPYTRILGPVITVPAATPFARGRKIRQVCRLLVEQLPPHDLYRNIVVDNDVAMAFSWLGYTTTQRYSFVFPADANPDRCWLEMNQKTRNMVRSAAKQLEVGASEQLDTFIDLSRRERRGSENRHDFGLVRQLFQAAAARGQAAVLSAADASGRVAAAAALIWGYGTVYFWLTARDRTATVGGANALLLWRAFELANRMNMAFDLDGYSSLASAEFLAGFGLPPTVRIEINRLSQRYEIVRLSRSILRSLNPRPTLA